MHLKIMVKIPREVKELIDSMGIFAVGSVGENKIANVSPRIFFEISEDRIYWLDFFRHKSYKNFLANPLVTVAVYDKKNLNGYQLRGTVDFISEGAKKSEIKERIIKKTLDLNNSSQVKKISQREAEVILFEPKVIYSLNPENFSDLPIGSDIDSTQIF